MEHVAPEDVGAEKMAAVRPDEPEATGPAFAERVAV